MDPATLGIIGSALFVKALEKASEKAGEQFGESVPGALGELLAWVRGRFRGSRALELVEAAPDSARAVSSLAKDVEVMVQADPSLARELLSLIAAARDDGDDVSQVIGTAIATSGGVVVGSMRGNFSVGLPTRPDETRDPT